MIIGTAGHVDHGKTALVRALTGVDTDRLPEEKARGLSIDLGFAYRELPGGTVLGFIDVPGHERFVHTMVAGVAGIHHALFVVAADDGPMPQTEEHLAILGLLGVPGMSVILTKTDRVEPERVEIVAAQMQALLAGTAFAEAPVIPVSAITGAGMEVLNAHLAGLAAAWIAPPPRGRFRLAVDRCFTLPGAGLIVTGTSFAGTVKPDDALIVSPGDIRARVRGLHAQNRRVDHAGAGERCALNLAGAEIKPDSIRRGDWIVAEGLHAPTRRIDVRLHALATATPLRQGARVHVHLGSKSVTGHLIPLGIPALAPSQSALSQIVLDEEIGALWGDRFVLRDWSARKTLAGGIVLDPFPPARGRTAPARLAALEALEQPDPALALAGLIAIQGEGIDLERFAQARNLAPGERERVFGAVEMVRSGSERKPVGFSRARWEQLRGFIIAALGRWHRDFRESPGPSLEQLRRSLSDRLPAPVFRARLSELVQSGEVALKGNVVHLPAHQLVMSKEQLALWQKAKELLERGGTRPPPVGEIATALGLTPPNVENLLKRVAGFGWVTRVADTRFFPPPALLELACAARDLGASHEDGLFPVAEFRDRTGIGRNLTIEVLQFFDRVGLTRRIGDSRRLIRPPEEIFRVQE